MALPCFAQMDQINATWDEANTAYSNGNYNEAIDAYRTILEEDPMPEIFYNLGNAYFKTGEIAQAILAYERCLRLDPTNEDAKFNRDFAQTRIIDNIEDNAPSLLNVWAGSLRNCLSEKVWFFLSVSLFVLCLVGFFLFAFMSQSAVRKTAFFCAIFALLFSIVGMSCGISAHKSSITHDEAIIMQGIVNAKSSPDKSGTDLFVLHEGTKVTITDKVGEWCEVRVGDNKGWIQGSTLERI